VKYNFPTIVRIDQVRNAIKNKPEFIEVDKDDYIVFNYLLVTPDTFPTVTEEVHAILRECRGLIFSKQGDVISRRFHKFFNANEREETSNIDVSKSHVVLEKLDGSMISPIPIGKYIRWTTKMGITDTAMKAERYIAKHPKYEKFARECIRTGYTPIFEFISPNNQIVVRYKKEDLVLLAIRNNLTGYYVKYDTMKLVTSESKIPIVQPYEGSLDELKDRTDMEGVILRFDDGHMVKMKCDWYVNLHKAKDQFQHEKNVLKLILDEKDDDLIPFLMDEDKKRLINYKKEVLLGLKFTAFEINQWLGNHKDLSRKDFAIYVAPKLDTFKRRVCFNCFGNDKSIEAEVIKVIYSQLGTQAGVDSIRPYIGGVHWNVEIPD